MRIHDDIEVSEENGVDDEVGTLSVAEMIGHLRAVELNMADDPCLEDLKGEVSMLRMELEQRRQLAIQIAAEIDAENCNMPN